MMDGWEVFTRDLLRDRSRAKLTPLVFAIMTNGEPFIQVAHCFGQMALEMEDHSFDGVLGCFLGDRTIMSFSGNLVIQEPDFVALRDTTAIRGISTKPAADGAIRRIGASGDFVKGNARADEVDLPLCLPLPLTWVPYFLEKRRTNNEAYVHMSEHMDMWEGSKAMGAMVRGWFRAACTRHPSSPDYSILDIGTRTVPRDAETVPWTLAHLQAVVPRPIKPAPRPQNDETPALNDGNEMGTTDNSTGAARTAELYNRILALSNNVLANKIDRDRPSETAKTLSEVELCRLLGFCGLGWQERHLLPPIWADLKKQPDRASRETVLSAFFDDLAKEEPSLRHFNNQALFEDIINHRFTPGDSYETCHKGFSPLAFLPKTHAMVHEEALAEDYYNEANVKTVAEVHKHQMKGPPPIPNNDAELLRLNTRDVTVLTAFFTKWSSLVQQELELNDGLQEQQMDMFSRPDSTREMIPQFLWAKIKARRQFFLQTCTKAMLDGPGLPNIAKAKLSAHTLMFLSGTKVSIIGVPQQWLGQDDKPGPTKKPRHDNTEHDGTNRGDDARNRSMPTQGSRGTNTSGPPVFAQSSEVNDLLRKHPLVQLGMVAKAAGFANTGALPTKGLPPRSCLRWICFGKCTYSRCHRSHPTAVDNTAATTLFRALLPGINSLRARTDLPAPEKKN
jgi:hypothetical protein